MLIFVHVKQKFSKIFVSREINIYICSVKIKDMENETLNIITETFSNVAFPVAVCVALFWILAKQNNEIKTAIENNTKVLIELTTIIKLLQK